MQVQADISGSMRFLVYLDDVLSATRWVLDDRALPDGGFRHSARLPLALFSGPAWASLDHLLVDGREAQHAIAAGLT